MKDERWKVVTSFLRGGEVVYALARYETNSATGILTREPEHQNWSLKSGSLQELVAKVAASGIGESCFGTRHFNNFAPQSLDPKRVELVPFDEWVGVYSGKACP